MDVEMEELDYEDVEDVPPTATPAEVQPKTGSEGEKPADSPSVVAEESPKEAEQGDGQPKSRTITWTDEDKKRSSAEEVERPQKPKPEEADGRRILKPRTSGGARREPPVNFDYDRPEPREDIEADQIELLYDSLQISAEDREVRLSAVFVHSLKPLSVYEVGKIFADYRPTRCALLSANTALVKFTTEYEAAEALIGATKRLIRVRKQTEPEDGEIDEDAAAAAAAEEDEHVRFERGDEVLVFKGDAATRKRKAPSDAVELDVEQTTIPAGKWRLVVVHVPKDRHVFCRFATGFELRQSLINPFQHEATGAEEDEPPKDEEFEQSRNFKKRTIRPGLNVFNDQGEELSHRYEHDVRFYEHKDEEDEAKKTAEDADRKPEEPQPKEVEITTSGGAKIRSRGRGAKKFLIALDDLDD